MSGSQVEAAHKEATTTCVVAAKACTELIWMSDAIAYIEATMSHTEAATASTEAEKSHIATANQTQWIQKNTWHL